MNAMAYTYLVYLAVTIGITIWVARTLRHNGLIFLARSEAEVPLAEALSHLLVVGFYLVNFGAISFLMQSREQAMDVQTGIELLSTKVGLILVGLGMMHFLILLVFARIRNRDEAVFRDDNHRKTLRDLAELQMGSH